MTAPPSRLDDKAMAALVDALATAVAMSPIKTHTGPSFDEARIALLDAISALQKERDDLRTTFGKLHARVLANLMRKATPEEIIAEYNQICTQLDEADTERDALRADNERLANALGKYGVHDFNCALPSRFMAHSTDKCTCGLDAALSTEGEQT